MRYGLRLPHHNPGLCLVLDLDWLGMTLTDSARPQGTAICSRPLAFTASLALLSSLSLSAFVVSPSMLQIKACARDRQASVVLQAGLTFLQSAASLSISDCWKRSKNSFRSCIPYRCGNREEEEASNSWLSERNYDCGLGRPSGQLQGKSPFF